MFQPTHAIYRSETSSPKECLVAAPVTFAIGDIHGCLEKLESLLAACDVFSGGQSARFVFIGDYIDRGPRSKDVIDLLIKGGGTRNRAFVCLRGNHEEMLLRAADPQRSDRDLMMWWGNGGEQTLESYGVEDPATCLPNISTGCAACLCNPAILTACSCMRGSGRVLRYPPNQLKTCSGSESRSCRPKQITASSWCTAIPQPALENPNCGRTD